MKGQNEAKCGLSANNTYHGGKSFLDWVLGDPEFDREFKDSLCMLAHWPIPCYVYFLSNGLVSIPLILSV